MAVDGKEQGPLNRTDAAKLIVSLKPEKSVRVWKEGMDGWKRPSDVAIIAQEISVLRQSPLEAPRAGSSSALRPATVRADSAPGVRAPGRPLPTGGSGSGPKLPQPGSGLKSPPVSGSGPKAAPPPLPGSGPKAAPPAIAGSGPKAVPPPIPGSEPKARPSVPGPGAQLVSAAGSSPSLKKGPALPGVTPMSSGHSVQETEFDKAPATRPEKRLSAARGVVASDAPVPVTAQPAAPHDGTSDDEFDQAQKTPPSGHPLPPVVAPLRDGRVAPMGGAHPPALPKQTNFSAAGSAAIAAIKSAPAAGSLFGNVALAPPEPWRTPDAHSGLSKLAALTRRHRHLKYVVAASAVVVLVILVILFSWRNDSGKAATAASKPAASAPEVPSLAHVEPLPQDGNTVARGAEPKGRTGARAASKRPAVVHSAGPSAKGPAVGEDPFEGPSAPSHSTERPVPVVAPDQSRRSHSGLSGGAVREVTQSQLHEFVKGRENQAGIRMCYERALKRDSRLRTGRLDITVSVGATGVVQNVQVHGPADFLIMEDCVKTTIRHWHFPPNVEEYATSFPFIMQGG